ncbi:MULTISPECIES: Txe/YoeB family addiction module toxin [Nocardia]|uniref:Endoribonuclease YoeB n=1 Tax=Nocardia implantans TaxID=3108168 RepID=A0ABU6ANY1_9NOCA|nr:MULTISPECIES: Txe/YoeB family addiction module toxin [unclassified Nocardia]MBF6192334.1 Txe/YoeB family addiction module toxin [Nocardia beijingensis]MEA3531087.1 Txe/YoeB family addiction module toxin [Nocardia sp. CDC192]MEB3509177.1 Txe/YoeB family addiction module toxin [Nocardia sp. CDC186]
MKVVFSESAWEEYAAWLQRDRLVLKKVNVLIKAILCDPFEGIGKPEPLKHDLAGYWSRRITQEHRLVYRIVDDAVWIAKVGKHYD